MRPPPRILGVDLAARPQDRQGVMEWRDGVRFLHALPQDAAVTFYRGRCIVVHPNGPAYEVDPDTGDATPLEFKD